MFYRFWAPLLGAILMACASQAMAHSAPMAQVNPQGDHRSPRGWVAFCAQPEYAALCKVNTAEPAAVAMTPAKWLQVWGINRWVNATLRPGTDLEQWGFAEVWTLGETGAGDCEEYALLKRQHLVALGFPARALRLTLVLDEAQQGHLVLMLRTTAGDFILDNVDERVLPWHQVRHVLVKRERQDQVGWIALRDTAASN